MVRRDEYPDVSSDIEAHRTRYPFNVCKLFKVLPATKPITELLIFTLYTY